MDIILYCIIGDAVDRSGPFLVLDCEEYVSLLYLIIFIYYATIAYNPMFMIPIQIRYNLSWTVSGQLSFIQIRF